MALPYIIKCIYNNGSEESIRRGKKIHTSGNVELIENNAYLNNVVFRVTILMLLIIKFTSTIIKMRKK